MIEEQKIKLDKDLENECIGCGFKDNWGHCDHISHCEYEYLYNAVITEREKYRQLSQLIKSDKE